MNDREADPLALLDRMKSETKSMPGFRFFHDHDPRVLEHCLPDPACAKIILTRNPVDSYVSRKIAETTGQWRLGDMKAAKSAQIFFDPTEFEAHLNRLQQFQMVLMRGLQITGQTAFYIAYDDLHDVEVLDGLARHLGVDHHKKKPSQATKVQNPAPLETKVKNYADMESTLSRLDKFDLGRTPNFEPRRTPGVPTFVAGAETPLLYQPIKSGPRARILAWLAALDGVTPDDLRHGFSQKSLRQWKRQNKLHRSFTVVRHPVLRLHKAFMRHFLEDGPETFWEIRETLRSRYKVPLPEGMPTETYTPAIHKAAFLEFAKFVAGNLGGQTSIRVDPAWGTQVEILHGMAQVQIPDIIIREDDLTRGLAYLTDQVGAGPVDIPDHTDKDVIPLDAIYDQEVEAAVRTAYQRDYMMFGFKPWRR
jgi:hypothetical protein